MCDRGSNASALVGGGRGGGFVPCIFKLTEAALSPQQIHAIQYYMNSPWYPDFVIPQSGSLFSTLLKAAGQLEGLQMLLD